ncbi:MAG: hypothetical protein HY718_01425 [Planctomycetes bacterium]|nr:hypothetical protein [Planctomycetota bacterium]
MMRKPKDIVLWETMPWKASAGSGSGGRAARAQTKPTAKLSRLPGDDRCRAMTKSRRPCRGKIVEGSDFCVFHDPKTASKMRERHPVKTSAASRRLSRLPDGYLRKLTSRRAIGLAMDRLYREVRLEIITPEMGNVLLGILGRLLDSGLPDRPGRPVSGRARADRLRPRVKEMLTRAERAAWRKAIAAAPENAVDDAQLFLPFPRGAARGTA